MLSLIIIIFFFRTLVGHEAMITALAFTPDSAFLLSCSTAGDILLWDALYGHGKCLSSVTDAHDLGVLCCDFSPQYDAVGMIDSPVKIIVAYF